VPDSNHRCLAIFDHDGVLVDSYQMHLNAWVELGRRTGLPFTPDFVHKTFGMTNPAIFEALLGHKLDDAEAARLGDLKEACYRDEARACLTLMPGVRDLLDKLADSGVALAIGSSAPLANLELTVEACGLRDRFAAIASLEDITRGKPDPEIFLTAARKAAADPRRSIVFEDALVGVQAARAARMIAVGVGTTHPTERLVEAGAHVAVSSLVDFPIEPWLERLRLQD
jgi:HAD superfamily hydrolase (TIGR01509 family)